MADHAIVLSRHGHATGLRIVFVGPLARTMRVEPKPTTFNAEQLEQLDEDAAPIFYNRARALVGLPMIKRGRW